MEKEKDIIVILCKGIYDNLRKHIYCDKISVKPFEVIAQEGKHEDIYVEIERKGFKFNYQIMDAWWSAYYGVSSEEFTQEILAKYRQAVKLAFFK